MLILMRLACWHRPPALHFSRRYAIMRGGGQLASTDQPNMRWRPRVRFRLATLLAAITALCVWLGMTVDRAYRQQRGVERVQKLGGAVFFDYQKGPDNPAGRNVPLGGGFDDNAQPRGPQWARNWLGEAYFRKALCVRLWDARLTDDD